MPTRNVLPRWRGFNLLEMHADERRAPFAEDDFRWIASWGFDFVRLPLSYTHWLRAGDPMRIDEDGAALDAVDRAVELGGRYGLHVCLNLHRAPGYCVNPVRREPFDLWRDPAAVEALCLHWQTLARRYRGVGSLSFDLINEPPYPWPRFTGAFSRAAHSRVIRQAVAAIRQVDRERLIIVDGLNYGRLPCPELADLPNVAQSCRAYEPFALTHYRANWVSGSGRWRAPRWPRPGNWRGRGWTRERLAESYAPWAALIGQGVGVHCGEAGCYRHTPHAVFLAWFRDVLAVLAAQGIGWALWNFRGAFGVLDSGRADVDYQDWQGHALDRQLLALLQSS